MPPPPGLTQGAGYLLQEDGLAFEDHRNELPAFLAEDGPPGLGSAPASSSVS